MKFGIGDRVKVIKNITTTKEKDNYVGKVYTIKDVYKKWEYSTGQAYSINEIFVVYEDELELVQKRKFSKEDLRDGMVVEYHDGNRGLILKNEILNFNHHSNLDRFNNNLEHSIYKDLNIDKVYESEASILKNYFDDKYLNLIWERTKDESVKKMTVAEIEKELGYKIEVIGG